MTWPAPDSLDAVTLIVAAILVEHRRMVWFAALAARLLGAAKTAPAPLPEPKEDPR